MANIFNIHVVSLLVAFMFTILQGHPATVFCKISGGRSKYCV